MESVEVNERRGKRWSSLRRMELGMLDIVGCSKLEIDKLLPTISNSWIKTYVGSIEFDVSRVPFERMHSACEHRMKESLVKRVHLYN